ncbi:MAG: NAD-dependent DNA ligase LigA [Bacillota bacterium]|nr:NAD-dependent DNA ligase LigA [Bacillota bacterium]
MNQRMEQLVAMLNDASRQYYQYDREIMSNQEYDKLYDELVALEKETGITLSSSPTINVGYEVVSDLPKERHPSPMLSLDKTKDVQELKSWLGDKEGLLSWKLDGLTVVLTYENGELTKAVTRGDGVIGEVITPNARAFENIPLRIPDQRETVVRGEAVISYSDFEEINEAAAYKNPRNLCSGSVRQLNSEITAKRHVKFFAFSLAVGGDPEFTLRSQQMQWIRSQGFETVSNVAVDAGTIEKAVQDFDEAIKDFDIPSDGLVLIFDDIAYGRSLGSTAKFPRDAIAFKWQDEIKETTLKEVLWNASRTGLINPIAVFEPVELEGTTVTRASVHNLSIVEELALGTGDHINVYKANMIIPQIAENLTRSGTVKPPEVCPVCGQNTIIKDENGVRTLHCPNPDCPAKMVKAFTHFVSRNAMNIEGLSEATLEKFIDEAMIREFADIFKLQRWRDRIVGMEGFGEKSFEKLVSAAEKASETTPARLLYAIGIPNIGVANARMISRACSNNWDRIQHLTEDELSSIDGIGDVMAKAYVEYFKDEKNAAAVAALLDVLSMDESFQEQQTTSISGKTFVITGSLTHFENRDACKEKIESLGGKTAGSVSKKTDYLINNDINSASSKNKKAKELGIPIITEEDFLAMIQEA